MIELDFIDLVGNENVVMFSRSGLEVDPCDMRFDQIGEDQMRKDRKIPGLGFFLVEDVVDYLPQVGIRLFVIAL